MQQRYINLHNDWDDHLVFPFVVQPHKAEKVYEDSIWGIAVSRVTADGVAIAGKKYQTVLDDLNFNKTTIGKTPLVYLVPRSALIFATKFDEKGGYELVKFDISKDVKRLEIEYSLRESPDSIGPSVVLESRLT